MSKQAGYKLSMDGPAFSVLKKDFDGEHEGGAAPQSRDGAE